MDPATFPTTTYAPVAALLVLLAALLVIRRRKRTRATGEVAQQDPTGPLEVEAAEESVLDEPEPEPEPEPEAESGAEGEGEVHTEPVLPEATDRAVPTESAEVRALRMQVRSLEEALARLPDPPVTPVPPARVTGAPALPAAQVTGPVTAQGSVRDGEAYRRQVRLTIRALAAHTAEAESPHRVLARVAAAIDRLEPTEGLTRPALPPALHRTAPAVRDLGPEPDTLEPQPAVPVPAVEPFDVPELRRASAAEVVLPVPPPTPTPPKRKGRRLRRQAA